MLSGMFEKFIINNWDISVLQPPLSAVIFQAFLLRILWVVLYDVTYIQTTNPVLNLLDNIKKCF